MLQSSGCGKAIAVAEPMDAEACLKDVCAVSNAQLLESLKEDEHAEGLMNLARLDASLGRMSEPVPADQCCLDKVLLAPRFAVEQGVQVDGSVKIRAIANFSWSRAPVGSAPWRSTISTNMTLSPPVLCALLHTETSINGCTAVPEKIAHDHLDDLLTVIAALMESTSVIP